MKVVLKWKKVKATSTKKADLIDAYVAAEKPKIQKIWSCFEEEELVALKSENVDLKDTALGNSANQMARAVTNHVAKLSGDARVALLKSLQDYEQENGPNIL